jgi:hypothetical protein
MFFLILGYLLFLTIFATFSYFALYHLWRFGFVGDATRAMITGYLAVVSVVIVMSFLLLIIMP